MKQQWRNLLFLHWPVDPHLLRAGLPAPLELDTFEGQAWLGVVPFDMKGVTARGCPAPSAISDFPEINLRTYVTCNGKPGVWFLSLDVPHRLPVWAARTFFHLPYFRAEMSCRLQNGRIDYRHQRKELRFEASYAPVEEVMTAEGSFEHWATSRYCLYCQSKSGRVYRGEIHHAPWPLQQAEVEIQANSFLDRFLAGPRHPSALFSGSLDVVVYPLEKL